ncbi:S14_ClpP_1 domain containing protein [uncultured Caudovirales phage]|uniref:S14_ClpP_1 domain containing protein n=1 Tax=uncultured Caudovirales phage TaxID=2100421 RepID=A0A6J5RE05_9CAUD|nr:S14_ClpP_1 domain containing protein [uncultured Caudovirales phage]
MSTKFRFIQNYSSDQATILLYDDIGRNPMDGSGIDGNQFAQELNYLSDIVQPAKINCRINSVGGSVIDGMSIFASILNAKVPVYTFIDGVAASIAAVIALSGKEVVCADYGRLMIHNASMPGETMDVAAQTALASINTALCTMIANRCGQTMDEVATAMTNETWYTAEEAMANGLVDSIATTKKQFSVPAKATATELRHIYNQYLQPKMNMKNITNALNLQNEATEVEIESAIELLKKQVEEANAKIIELEAEKIVLTEKVEAIDAEKTSQEETAAIEIVNAAILCGKITNEQRESFINKAKQDYNFIKETIDAMPIPAKKISVAANVGSTTNNAGAERANWTIRDWEKKDPNGLTALKVTNNDEFVRMFKAGYGIEPKF